MAKKLLDNASFGLLRTNPALTTNVKITYTSNSELYLNSIDASYELSKSSFKNYKTSSENYYQWDLYRFWKAGITPNNITHRVGEVNDPTQVQDNYSKQYDTTYTMGAKYENSRVHDEDYSFFAPLWLNKTIPEKFVIFRVNDPSFFETSKLNESDVDIEAMMKDPSNFKKYILDNATIVKAFDLGPTSELGKYIRNYTNQGDFPNQSLNIRYGNDDFTSYYGVSLKRGEFSEESEKLHTNLVARDQTVIEFDNYVTKGFERNNLAIANILNLEFLFNDNETDDFSINRYFGFYVQEVEEGEAATNELISLDDNRIKLKLEDTIYSNSELQDLASIYYIKDKNNKYYKIDSDSQWDDNEIVINERLTPDDDSLFGISDSQFSAPATKVSFKGFSYIEMEITGEVRSGDFYYLGEESNEFLIVANHNIIKAGTSNNNQFSISGDLNNIADAIASAINFNFETNGLIRAYTRNNKVIVYSILSGSRYNLYKVIRNKNIFNNSIKLTTDNNRFFNGTDDARNTVRLDISYLETLSDDKYFVNTNDGFKEVSTSRYLGSPIRNNNGLIVDFADDERFVLIKINEGNLEININSLGNVNFYTINRNRYGFFSIFPLKDFDFDFHSTEYSSNDNQQMINYYDSLDYRKGISGSTDLSVTSNRNRANLLKYDYDFTFKRFGDFTNLVGLENSNGELNKVSSEYDRLQENNLKDLSTYSRLSPFVNKWVKSGNNVKELPYRLNTNFAFGLDNFSPSFEIKTPNPQYFTHEWYYLGEYPSYVDKSKESVKNYYQFFESNFDIEKYLDPDRDYFTEYFTLENKGNFSINTELKYSRFTNGSNFNFAQTFFRGVKLYAKKRRENETNINFNVDSIEYLKNSEYNDYKFSAVLQPRKHSYTLNYNDSESTASVNGGGVPLDNPGERIPKTKITIIENKKFKNITFLIDFKLPESNLFKFFFDSIFLYAYKSIKLIKFLNENLYNGYQSEQDFLDAIQAGDFEFVYPDTPLTSTYDIRGKVQNNRYQEQPYLNSRKIVGSRSFGTFTRALEEVILNRKGNRNNISLINKGTTNPIWKIKDIVKVVTDRIIFANEVSKDTDNYEGNFNNQEIDFGNFAAVFLYPYYEEGGFDFFRKQIEDISFANLFEKINEGSPDVEYVTIPADYDGSVIFEDLERDNFTLQFEQPFSIEKSKYLTIKDDREIPPGLTTETSIGFETVKENLTSLLPMNRYGGAFLPKFNDVLSFTDKNSNKESLKNLNREFDIENKNFGLVKNLYYSKVSPESFNRILTINPQTGFTSRYPLIGEIGIDKKDTYVFLGNWELGYYQKNIDKNKKNSKFGTWSSLEKKNFQASKLMNIPNLLSIEELTSAEEGTLEAENADIVYTRVDNQTIQLNVNLEQKIINKLFELGIADTFDKYVNYNFTIQGNREDYISDYIRKNIFPRYRLDEITFWVNSALGSLGLPLVFNQISNIEKIQRNFKQSLSFNYNTTRNSNFNFTLNGNLNSTRFQSFSTAISVRLIKR